MNFRFILLTHRLSGLFLLIFSLLVLSGCAGGIHGKQSGWWGSKQDRQIITNADIRKKLGKPRPITREPGYHLHQGISFQTQGKHRLALEEFQRVLDQEPEHIKALNAKGISHDKLGQFDQALESYQAALKQNPDLDYVHNNLGYSYFLQGEYTLAVKAFEKAAALDESRGIYHNNLGMAYARAGNFKKAVSQFTKDSGIKEDKLPPKSVTIKSKSKTEGSKNSKPLAKQVAKSPEPARLSTKLQVEKPEKSSARPKPRLAPHTDSGQRYAKDDRSQDVNPSKTKSLDQERQSVYAVQAGAFDDQERAAKLYFRFLETGYKTYIRHSEAEDLYKVRVGTYPKLRSARIAAKSLSKVENMNTYVVKESLASQLASDSSHQAKAQKDQEVTTSEQEPLLIVLNGNGVNGMARRTGGYLDAQGFEVIQIRNADHFNHPRTIIYYSPGGRSAAQRLSKRLPENCELRRVDPLAMPQAGLRMVLGKDLARHAEKLKITHIAKAQN